MWVEFSLLIHFNGATTFSITIIVLSIMDLIVTLGISYQWHYVVCYYAKCRILYCYAERHYAECWYAENHKCWCCYAECRLCGMSLLWVSFCLVRFMLSVVCTECLIVVCTKCLSVVCTKCLSVVCTECLSVVCTGCCLYWVFECCLYRVLFVLSVVCTECHYAKFCSCWVLSCVMLLCWVWSMLNVGCTEK